LAQKAQELGYHPEIILAGRRMNDGMGAYVAKQVVKNMIHKGIVLKDAKVLLLGITFKENCPDVRNTKIVDVVAALQDYGLVVDIYDPWASAPEVQHEYGIKLIETPAHKAYDAVVLGVAHNEFKNLQFEVYTKPTAVVYDVKGVLDNTQIDSRL
jgi:UDP-N-acetyl-D-galactosamine dehydrogenase